MERTPTLPLYIIFYVQDRLEDAILFEIFLSDFSPFISYTKITFRQLVQDGLNAFEVGLNNNSIPKIIVFDIPGFEEEYYPFLKALKEKTHIIAIWTGNESPRTIRKAYELGINFYLFKGANLDENFQILSGFFNYCKINHNG